MVYALSTKSCNPKANKYLLKVLVEKKVIDKSERKELEESFCRFNNYLVYQVFIDEILWMNNTTMSTIDLSPIDFANLILTLRKCSTK